jgi:hypothetical protein
MTTFNLGNTCGGGTVAHTKNIDGMIAYHPEEGTGPSSSIYSYDLTVYHLQSPIYDVVPLHINSLGRPPNGTQCWAVGFGLDGMGGSGTKRSASVTVDSSGEVGVTVAGTGWVGMHSAIKIDSGTGLPQKGDSGGPLLCGSVNGTDENVNVIQGVFSGTFDWPFTGSYYTALSAIENTSDGPMYDSAWVTNVASNYTNEPLVSVATQSSSRFDLFARHAPDGVLITKHWDSAAPLAPDNSHWYPSMFTWDFVMPLAPAAFNHCGDPIHTDVIVLVGTPEALSWGAGRMDVFVRDPRLWHLIWNGSSWCSDGPLSSGLASHPVAVSMAPNHLDVVAVISDGSIAHYFGADRITGFQHVPSDPTDPTVGGPGTFLPEIKVISTDSSSFDLYAVGTDMVLYHNHYNGNTFGFTAWDNLGGQVVGTPAVTTWGGGRQDIFVKSTDNNLYQKVYLGGIWYPGRPDYYFLGGPIDGSPAAASMKPNWLTLASNWGGSAGGTDSLAAKEWFNGTQWDPTNTTWHYFSGIEAGPPVLVAVPNVGVNLFVIGGGFDPGIGGYNPNGPAATYGWSAIGSLGGTVSW